MNKSIVSRWREKVSGGGLRWSSFLILSIALIMGGFFVYNAMAEEPIFSVSITPDAVDINQIADIDFNITASGSNIKTIAVSVEDTGFSNPTDFACPSGWSKIDAMPPILNGYVCDDPTDAGLASPVVILMGLITPNTAGDQNFSVSAINTDDIPQTENSSVLIEVKNLSATAELTPATTNTNQERTYTFTTTNNGEDDIIQIDGVLTDFNVNNCSATGWICTSLGETFTLSGSSLATGNPIAILVTATAPATLGEKSVSATVTGLLGGTATVSVNLNNILVQTLPNIIETTTTILPATVSQGQAGVSFSVNVQNTGGVDVVLDTNSTISFTDGSITYSAELSAETTIVAGQTSDLVFTATNVDVGIVNNTYDPTLTLSGTDANTADFTQTINTASNQITVQTQASLSVEGMTSDVSAISKSSAINTATISIPVTNSGQATAVIDTVAIQIFDQATTPNDISDYFTITRIDSIGNNIDGSQILTYTIIPNSSESYEGLVDVKATIDYKDANTGLSLSSVSGSEAGIFKVDNTSPVIDNAAIIPASPINNNTPTVSFNISDTGVGIDWSTVQINDVLINISECTLTGDIYSCSNTFSALADGTYTFTISASDNVENSASDNSLIGYVIDTQKPTTIDDYGTKSGVWQNEDQIITLAPFDPTPSSGVAWTKYCTDTANTCEPTTEGTSLTISTEGTTYFRYASADNAGNVQNTVSLVVMIDKTVPTTSEITAPTADSYVKETVTITANAIDNTVGSGIAKVEFYYNENLINTDTDNTDSIYSVDWDTIQVTDNTVYSLTSVAIDEAGNPLTSSAVSVTVDNTPPEIETYTISNPEFSPNDDSVKDATTIDLKFSETVDYNIKIKSGETIIKNWTGTALNPIAKIWDGEGSTGDGVYTVEITITDRAGTVATDTSETITIDNTDPTISAGDDKTTNAEFTQDATVIETGSGVASYEWTDVTSDGAGTITFGSATTEDTNISASTDDTYTISLSVTDNAGNIGTNTMTLVWDTAVPTAEITSPSVNNVVKDIDGNVTLEFDSTSGSVCEYEINDNGTWIPLVNCTTGQTITLADGRQSVILKVTDLAGNYTESVAVSFVVDTDNTLDVLRDFTTIQGAINKATAGDTISIAAGTYYEVGQIVIDKNLTIVGADKATTIIKPNHNTTVAGYVQSDAWIYVPLGVTFALNEVTLDGTDLMGAPQIIRHAIQSRGELTVEDCIIKNITTNNKYYGRGIVLLAGLNNSIVRCEFSNIQRIGIHVRGNVEDTNPVAYIKDCTYTGKGDGDWLDYGIEFGGGGSGIVDGCNISACTGVASVDGSTSAGILATDYYGTGTMVTVENSTLTGNTAGIAVGYAAEDTTKLTAYKNTFSDNTYGIENVGIREVNATANWWGAYVESEIQNIILGSVDYSPWYMDEDMTTLSNSIDLTVVYVDDNYDAESCADYYWNFNCFDTIQEGIDAVQGSTVNVAAGTYNENVEIRKTLTLLGAGADVTTIEPFSGRVINIRAQEATNAFIDGITIQGFTLRTNDNNIALQSDSANDDKYNGKNYLYKDLIVDANSNAQTAIGLFDVDGVVLDNVVVKNSARTDGGAIEMVGVKDFMMENSELTNNALGLKVFDAAGYMPNQNITVTHSRIVGNDIGIINSVNGLTLNAVANWWGYDSGPAHTSNTSGTGDSVSDNVDYRPWYTVADTSTILDETAPTAVLPDVVSPVSSNEIVLTVSGDQVVYYKYKLDNENYGVETAIATPITESGLAEGEYVISVIGRDQAGNWQETPTTYTWTVDTEAPAEPSILAIDINIANPTMTIFGTGEANTIVNYSITDTNIGTVTDTDVVGGNGDINITGINVSILDDGELTISVTLTDTADNTSEAAVITVDKDTIAPVFIINDDVDAGPVQTDTINITITEINLATSEYGFSADDVCDANNTINTGFTSAENFSIAGNHTDYLCVKAVDTAGNTTYQSVGQLNTDNTDPEVILYSQFTDQTLIGGNIYPLSWKATDINLGANSIGLEYSTDDGDNWIIIEANTGNDGAYNWTVPKLNSSNCYIRITAIDLADNATQEESDTFAISYSEMVDNASPAIILNSPNGGETLEAGLTHIITWTANDNATLASDLEINLEYSLDGSATWNNIIGSAENDGAYIWTIPENINSNSCLVKIVVEDASNNIGSDISDSVFSIVEPTVEPTPICTDNNDGTWTCDIALNEGWNLISLPVILNDTNIVTVLAGISADIEVVKYYDSTIDGNWLDYIPGEVNTLETIEDGKGYWIKMDNVGILTVTGIEMPEFPNPSPIYEVIQGWNLIGLKSISARILSSDYLISLTGSYMLSDENNVNRNDDYMNSGEGYWLWMNQSGNIVTFSEE